MNIKLGYVPTIIVDIKTAKDWIWDFKAKTNNNGFEDFLDSGDTVSSLSITLPTGITITSGPTIINANTAVNIGFEFSGALATSILKVEASLITAAGLKDEFPVNFYIEDR